MFEHLCATLLQQSHLCPVPLEAQPVFWNFDHALHLYPIPDVLVLADRAPCASFAFPPMPADQADQSCVCLNPVRTLPVSLDIGMTFTTDVRYKQLGYCLPTLIWRPLWPLCCESRHWTKAEERCICLYTSSPLHWWP